MGEIIKYKDFLNNKIENVIINCEEIIFNTIQSLCEDIIYKDYTEDENLDNEVLNDLKDSINDWFEIQERKKERNIR